MSGTHYVSFAAILKNTGLQAFCLIALAFFVFGCHNTPKPQIPDSARQNAAQTSTPQPAGRPEPESGHFYMTAKPYTRWWWFASEIKKEDITSQLDWLKEHNFGGVEVAWVYPLNIERYKRFYTWITDEERQIVEPRQKWQSPEWSEMVALSTTWTKAPLSGMPRAWALL